LIQKHQNKKETKWFCFLSFSLMSPSPTFPLLHVAWREQGEEEGINKKLEVGVRHHLELRVNNGEEFHLHQKDKKSSRVVPFEAVLVPEGVGEGAGEGGKKEVEFPVAGEEKD
jgi:hypothetical protein